MKRRADKVAGGKSHLKYVIFEYNMLCPYPRTVLSQHVNGEALTLAEACHKLGFKTVASMPLAMGDALKEHSLNELLEFALDGCDHIIIWLNFLCFNTMNHLYNNNELIIDFSTHCRYALFVSLQN